VARSYWRLTPRQSVTAECGRRGTAAVIDGCADLIMGRPADASLVLALGGPHAERVLDGRSRDDQDYWLRVWGVRGLLWAWADDEIGDRHLAALRQALRDEEWRVREMACKVIARHRVGDLLEWVTVLRGDPVPRVSIAAQRAVRVLTGARA
jgi:hypothetical protein